MKVQRSLGTSATIYPATQLHIPEYLNSQCMLLFMNDFSLSYWSHGPITISIVLFWIYIACAYNWNWVSTQKKLDVKEEFYQLYCTVRWRIYRSFATRVSQIKMCDFLGETFKGFEVL
jgi:hypothetical protein